MLGWAEMEQQCTRCHIIVRPTDFYCFNCGNNLKPAPPSISVMDQINLYGKSILLPPFGLLWAIKYLNQSDKKSKMVGVVAIVLTLVSLIVATIWFRNTMNQVNEQITKQLSIL